MSQYLTNKIETIVDAGTSFGTKIESKEVKLDNYQSAKIIIKSGDGDETTTNATVVAILPDESEQEIKKCEIRIGQNNETKIDIVANELAHYEATSFKVIVDAVAESEITGTIIVVYNEARYSE